MATVGDRVDGWVGWFEPAQLILPGVKVGKIEMKIPKGTKVAACSKAGCEVRGLRETGTVKLQSKGVDKEAGGKLQF